MRFFTRARPDRPVGTAGVGLEAAPKVLDPVRITATEHFGGADNAEDESRGWWDH